MKPELQRIAIAEACGWQHCEINHHSTGMFRKGAAIGVSPNSERILHIPSYTTDLNAMHEAEKMLSWADEGTRTSERVRYLMNLEAVISGPMDRFGYRPNRTRSVPFAKAAQRAEAFLRTLGKWEDKP